MKGHLHRPKPSSCVHAYTDTVTKTISLSDEAYEALASLKGPGESFSDVALRLSRRASQQSILDLAGSWEMEDEEAEAMKRSIYEARDASLEPPVDLG